MLLKEFFEISIKRRVFKFSLEMRRKINRKISIDFQEIKYSKTQCQVFPFELFHTKKNLIDVQNIKIISDRDRKKKPSENVLSSKLDLLWSIKKFSYVKMFDKKN